MATKLTEEDLSNEKYTKHYDKNVAFRLLKKLRKATRDKPKLLAKSTGVVLNGLGHLLSALDNPVVPVDMRVKIIGTIGYIILPIDLIPDAIPVFGYADDAGVVGLLARDIKIFSSFSMDELDAEIDEDLDSVAESIGETVQLPVVVESEIKEIEKNPDEVDVPPLEENGNLPFDVMMANIEKSNELFQKFLDKNAELDNEFDEHVQEGEKKSGNMWDAINKI